MAALKTRKLGAGFLKFGEVGSEFEFGGDVTSVELAIETESADPIPVLSGGTFQDEGELTGTISGEFLQAYDKQSVLAWTWKNRGKVMPFIFVPREDSDLVFKGEVQIKASTVGGNVKEANNASFEFPLIGEPIMEEEGYQDEG